MTLPTRFSPHFQLRADSRLLTALTAATLATLLTGCAGFRTTATPIAQTGVSLSGSIHGGQQPVSSAHVYVYSAGATGYGSASTSLLTLGSTGVTTDGSNHGYVTTDANGNFTLTGNFVCNPASGQVYLLALGGNPGLGTNVNNSAIAMIAALGTCSALTPSTVINIDEVSTAAAVTALQAFMVDSTHIGASPTNAAGIANAFASIPNIADLATGTARTASLLGNGAVPQSKINTLADILAPCINSASPSSTPCASLFSNAKPAAGTSPTDTTAAMLDIAQNPINNVTALFGLIDANAPFLPALSAAPNDFTLGITYTGGGLTRPGLIAIDSNGAAWVANCPHCASAPGTDSIIAFSSQGAVLTGATGYTTSIHLPQGLALDASNNIWTTNLSNGVSPDQIVRMSPAGTVSTGFPFNDATVSMPLGIAIDSNGNAYITNGATNSAIEVTAAAVRTTGPVTSPGFLSPAGIGIDLTGSVFAAGVGSNSILKFSGSTGAVLSGAGAGYTGGGLNQPQGIALDGAGNVWTINQTNVITILNGSSGTPVLPNGFTASLSQASIISIDGLNTAWISNCRQLCGQGATGPDNLMHVTVAGTNLAGFQGFQDTHFATAGTTAIDAAGNVWVANNTGASLTKMLGLAAPVSTPLSPLNRGSRP
jgi:hypothetical protein